jgi:Ca2+-binding EF-hand superfamily protein
MAANSTGRCKNFIWSSVMNRFLSSLVGMVIVGAAVAVEIPDRGPIPFEAFDSDGNGAISEEEFYNTRAKRITARVEEGRPMRNLANAPQFSDIDSDGNGVLSPEELQVGQQGHMRQGMGTGPGAGGPGGNRPTFEEFDLNADGVLLEEEFNEAHGKRIAKRSEQGYPMRGLSNMRTFADFDADGDGQVTPEEFAAEQATHQPPGQQ